ncbi:MAG: hypothetical protein M1594_02235 [Candidatus Marsarchaeota archaeon]|nr:hypothetical protein [Candidatus Marsarchaeota archaeon]
MNNAILKQLVINTLFWTGIVGIILAIFSSQYTHIYFFLGLVVFNLILLTALKLLAPQVLAPPNQNTVGFKVQPLDYPKVMDESQKNYVPEFIEFDVAKNNGLVFQGRFERKTMEKLRDLINNALNTK